MRRPLAALALSALAAPLLATLTAALVAAPASAVATAEVAPSGHPSGIAAAADGTVWVALDTGDLVHLDARGATLGRVAVGDVPSDVTVAPDGSVWATLPQALARVSPSGALTTVPVATDCPLQAVAVDSAGRAYVAAAPAIDDPDCTGSLQVVDAAGTVSTGLDDVDVYDLAVAGGHLYAPDGDEGVVHRFDLGDELGAPTDLVTDGPAVAVAVVGSEVWVPLLDLGEIARIPLDGDEVDSTVAAGLTTPAGIAATGRGTAYVTNNESEGSLYEVGPSGVVAITSLPGVSPWGVAAVADGALVTDPLQGSVVKVADAAPTYGAVGATSTGPTTVAMSVPVDTHGNATTLTLQWGPTAAYGESASLGTLSAAATGPRTVAGKLYDLDPGTTYHLRFTATSSRGTATSGDVVVTTAPATTQAVKAKVKASVTGTRTRLTKLVLTKLAGGEDVTVTCKPKAAGCGRSKHYADVRAGTLTLTKLFAKPLQAGATVKVVVEAAGARTETIVVRTRRGQAPKVTTTR